MDVRDLEIYDVAMKLSDQIWTLVLNWGHFERKTIGIQIAKAADSIAANLSEGYGRYHFKENRHFCYYARGSLLETRTWLEKARTRGLISESEFTQLTEMIDLLGKRMNAYIKSIGRGA